MKHNAPVLLVICDGFGYRAACNNNPFCDAHMPFFKHALQQYPHTLLEASGVAVGLLPDMIGNSAVGHLTIGAGRVIERPIAAFERMIKNGSFFENTLLQQRFTELRRSGKTLHVIGLLSDGNSHGNDTIVAACIQMAYESGVQQVILHAILDGIDVAPRSAAHYLKKLQNQFPQLIIGSLAGRAYAMDRTNNAEYIQRVYDTLSQKEKCAFTWQQVLDEYYATTHTSDAFLLPVQLTPDAVIHAGDGILFTNIRADRMRELTQKIITSSLQYAFCITAVEYGPEFSVDVIYREPIVQDTLCEVLAQAGKKIFRIAETEKYAHITYFFDGGREAVRSNENKVLVQSLNKLSYDVAPAMSAQQITDIVCTAVRCKEADFYLVNYANADMVGHSGNYEATVRALECLDRQLQRLYDIVVVQHGGRLYITADHGNAELKYRGSIEKQSTAHTTSKVPFIVIDTTHDLNQLVNMKELYGLADIAPFILTQWNISLPLAMKHAP